MNIKRFLIRFIPGVIIILVMSYFLFEREDKNWTVYYSPDASQTEILAAKEIQKYLWALSGEKILVDTTSRMPSSNRAIVVGTEDMRFLGRDTLDLEDEEFIIHSETSKYFKWVKIVGGTPQAALYAAYELAEQLGVRFYLHGDVLPDKADLEILDRLDLRMKPLFKTRGIQPFHDFPEGPDWWTKEDYKAIIAQLPKLKMNFIGFHTYPEGGVGPEPLVWIGTPDQLNEDGTVKSAYPAKHMTTTGGTFGYPPKLTKDFSHGTGQLFPDDSYGTDYMLGINGWPETEAEQIELFNKTGDFFGEVFEFAHSLGVKTCVGTETPLTIPTHSSLKPQANLSLTPQALRLDSSLTPQALGLYKGIFSWIQKNYAIDYYWFWTPEGWTWSDNTQEELDQTKADLLAAQAAIDELGNPFQLATCGWVLGPKEDRALFDDLLPKSWPMSCINQQVGFSYVEPGFMAVEGRPKWAIPWLEDDPAMIIPQLWAGRMRKDAADALAYGCDGLLGIHWRTEILGPNVAALAEAAWDQKSWNPGWDQLYKKTEKQLAEWAPDAGNPSRLGQRNDPRDMPIEDFYTDWATANFGEHVGQPIGALFTRLDGIPGIQPESARTANLPRPSNWVAGPGGLVPDSRPWEEVEQDYAFVNEFQAFGEQIKQANASARYDYWLNQFNYLKAIGKLCCSLGEFQVLIKNGSDTQVIEKALAIRLREMDELSEVYKYLLNSINTRGGMGNLANWEQHVWGTAFKAQDAFLKEHLDDIPEVYQRSNEYPGAPRLIVPTIRSVIEKSEPFKVEVICANMEVKSGWLFYRQLGKGRYQKLDLKNWERAVHLVEADFSNYEAAVEWYVEVKDHEGETYHYPAAGKQQPHLVTIN